MRRTAVPDQDEILRVEEGKRRVCGSRPAEDEVEEGEDVGSMDRVFVWCGRSGEAVVGDCDCETCAGCETTG